MPGWGLSPRGDAGLGAVSSRGGGVLVDLRVGEGDGEGVHGETDGEVNGVAVGRVRGGGAVGDGVLFAVDAVFGDGGGGVESGGSPEKGEGFGGEVGGDGSGDDGGVRGSGLREGVGGDGEEAEEESQGWDYGGHFFCTGGIIHNVSFLQIGGEGFFLGGRGRVGTGAGRGLYPRPERSTHAKYLPCFQIRKGIAAINLSNCFLSSVALLSRGWIVPVGGATPDRLKVGGAIPDRRWLGNDRRTGQGRRLGGRVSFLRIPAFGFPPGFFGWREFLACFRGGIL